MTKKEFNAQWGKTQTFIELFREYAKSEKKTTAYFLCEGLMQEVSDCYRSAYKSDMSHFNVPGWDEAWDSLTSQKWALRKDGHWFPEDSQDRLEMEIEGQYYSGMISHSQWDKYFQIICEGSRTGKLPKSKS